MTKMHHFESLHHRFVIKLSSLTKTVQTVMV